MFISRESNIVSLLWLAIVSPFFGMIPLEISALEPFISEYTRTLGTSEVLVVTSSVLSSEGFEDEILIFFDGM